MVPEDDGRNVGELETPVGGRRGARNLNTELKSTKATGDLAPKPPVSSKAMY